MSRAVWQVGQMLRESGIALERLGCRIEGNYAFLEPRTCPHPPPAAASGSAPRGVLSHGRATSAPRRLLRLPRQRDSWHPGHTEDLRWEDPRCCGSGSVLELRIHPGTSEKPRSPAWAWLCSSQRWVPQNVACAAGSIGTVDVAQNWHRMQSQRPKFAGSMLQKCLPGLPR